MKCSRGLLIPLCIMAMGISIACLAALPVQGYNTNALWLEIMPTNGALALTILEPATNPPGMHDLFFSTNLDDSQNWTWIQRSAVGQTNLVVGNLPPDEGFFRLGVTNAIRPGFDQQILDPNDDGSTDLVPIGFAINFLGGSNAMLYVNNNGNVTFSFKFGAYQTATLNNLGAKIIAPFWADVDTRNLATSPVTYGTNTVDGRNAFGADWVNVGYYSMHADRLLSCQLVIIDRSDIASGDFDMEFNYFMVQWEFGDASTGYAPRAGYSDGITDYELPGSGILGSFPDSNPVTGLIYNSLNSPVPGRYVFYFRDGEPLP
jgi:hypothetical protein